MFTPEYHRLFKKDLERDKKSGKLSIEDFALLKEIMTILLSGDELPDKYKNHVLKGEWQNCYECHVKNDWLLVYQLDTTSNSMTFIRLGTHPQIFKRFK